MTVIGIIGFGIVGRAIHAFYNYKKHEIYTYDKYISEYNIISKQLLLADIIYVCVPTPNKESGIDLSALDEVIELLHMSNYCGNVIIKSTIIPGTMDNYVRKYPDLNLCYNPEFLSAKTNIEDYANQKHIILGLCLNSSQIINNSSYVLDHYCIMFPEAEISVCKMIEAESAKIFCNVFYAVKIQTFTELYLSCQKNGSDFNVIRDLMLKNKWINPMHTCVPNNGKISFSGMCFPKDIASFNSYLIDNNIDNAVISAACSESKYHNNCL